MEEEIDLREYIAILFKYWKWIIGIVVLFAVVAFVGTSYLTPTYQATSRIVILKSTTQISLEPKYQTGTNLQGNLLNIQETLVNLVRSTDVVSSVLEQSRDLLPPESLNLLSLSGKVSVEGIGNIISITIVDKDPVIASKLANIWAQVYEGYVNQLFGGNSISFLHEMQEQFEEVSQTYTTSQAKWEEFLASNQLSVLNREIEVKKERATQLKNAELAILDREVEIKTSQVQTLRSEDAFNERLPVFLFNLEQDSTRRIIEDNYTKLELIETLIKDAYTLRDQVINDSDSYGVVAGNTISFILLQNNLFGFSQNRSVVIQQTFEELIAGDPLTIEDVDHLISVIEARKKDVESDIAKYSEELLNAQYDTNFRSRSEYLTQLVDEMDNEILLLTGNQLWQSRSSELTQAIETLDIEISTLEAELERQRSERRKLEQERDLAWENLTTVQRKLAEVQLASKITDSQVRMASSAITPEQPIGPKRLLYIALAVALGSILAVIGVFLFDYWRK